MNTNISQNKELLPQSINPFINSDKINDVTLLKEVNHILRKLYKVIDFNPEFVLHYGSSIKSLYLSYMDSKVVPVKNYLLDLIKRVNINFLNPYEQLYGHIDI